MAFWGEGWGEDFEWGLSAVGEEWACDLTQARLLHWHPEASNIRNWFCAYGEHVGSDIDTLVALPHAFAVEFAVGAQLDVLGSIVGLPRSGATDTRYRTLLRIQIRLLLSAAREDANWTGTTNNLLGIVREFIGPGPAPIGLVNLPPKSFLLTIPDITDTSDLHVLISFLTKAVYSETVGYVLFATATEGSVWGSESVAVPGAGIWGSASVVVPGAATWGYTVTIGV